MDCLRRWGDEGHLSTSGILIQLAKAMDKDACRRADTLGDLVTPAFVLCRLGQGIKTEMPYRTWEVWLGKDQRWEWH